MRFVSESQVAEPNKPCRKNLAESDDITSILESQGPFLGAGVKPLETT